MQVAPRETSYGRERLGSGSEADRFRVDVGHDSLVEGLATRKALHLRDQRSVFTAVDRADANVPARVNQRSEFDGRTSVCRLLRALSISTQRLDWTFS